MRERARERVCVCALNERARCAHLYMHTKIGCTRAHTCAHIPITEGLLRPLLFHTCIPTPSTTTYSPTHPSIHTHTHTNTHTHTLTHRERERERARTHTRRERRTHALTHARTHAERERDRERKRDSIPPPCTDDMFPSFSSSSVTLSGCIAGACAYE